MSILAQNFKNHRKFQICTDKPLSSSYLGLPYRISNINHKKELLRGLWVVSILAQAHTYGGAVEPYDAGNLSVRDLSPKGPCTQQIVDTSAPKYLYRDYFKAKVYTIWVHGP